MDSFLEPDKPFKTIDEQLYILQQRNLTINNPNAVKDVLNRYGYYSIINGYGAPFEDTKIKEKEDKRYHDDTKFEDIYRQFLLDRDLSEILTPYILKIEEHLKTITGYIVSANFDVNSNLNMKPTSYLDKKHYKSDVKTYSCLKLIQQVLEKTTKKPTSWYRENRNNVPPWILFSNLAFGTLIRYFSILPSDLKKEIVRNFIPKKLSSSDFFYTNFFNNLELIRQFRNASAHGAMFSAQRFTSQSLTKTFKNESNCLELYSNKEFKNLGYGKGDFYSLLILLILLSNSRDIANSILTDVKMTIDANLKSLTNTSKVDQKGKEAFFDLSNLPIDYFIRLTKFIQKIY